MLSLCFTLFQPFNHGSEAGLQVTDFIMPLSGNIRFQFSRVDIGHDPGKILEWAAHGNADHIEQGGATQKKEQRKAPDYPPGRLHLHMQRLER